MAARHVCRCSLATCCDDEVRLSPPYGRLSPATVLLTATRVYVGLVVRHTSLSRCPTGQRRAASGVTINRRDLEWPRSHGADQVRCRIALLAVAQHEGSCLAAILGHEVYLSSSGGEGLLLVASLRQRSSLGLDLGTSNLGPRLAGSSCLTSRHRK